MTNTPTKKENQSTPDNVPSANPNEQRGVIAIMIEKEIGEVILKMRGILSGKKELFKLEEYLKQ